MPNVKFPIATRNGRPAHEAFSGMVTQALINEHGSYRAARAYLDRLKESQSAQLTERTS